MERYNEYKDSGVQWLGEIPRHWERTKVSRLFKQIGSGTTPSSGDASLYADKGTPWLQSGDFNNNEINSTSKYITDKALDNYCLKLYKPGSIVIAMYGASIGKVGLLNIATTVNQACCVLSDSDHLLQKYAFYVFVNEKENLIKKSKGGTQPNISQEIIKSHYIPLPPLSEQHSIVSYLDDKCGKIDKMIEGKQKQIELLAEMKQRIIADAVTRGLNPDVKMKATNIPWLPEIPEHWEMSKVSSHFKQRNEKVSDKDYPALSVSKQGVTPQLANVALSNAEGSSRKLVRVGDYAVNSRSDRKGSCGVSKYEGSVSLITIVLEPFNIDGDYVHYLFRSNPWIEEFYRNGRGIVADLWTTNYQMMKTMYMPIPPLSEQRAIVLYITEKTAKIDTLTSKLQQEIESIKEYKQRLISDVVTGQIKVC